jgi:hypothetical protein
MLRWEAAHQYQFLIVVALNNRTFTNRADSATPSSPKFRHDPGW